jgi:2-methylcitrate dehydratase PrpD
MSTSAASGPALAARLAEALVARRPDDFPAAAYEKLRLCLIDFLACALEARSLPWARQAAALAADGAGPCSVVGTALRTQPGDAAFANAVAGHGLVREDMHAGSVSHLGVVVLPALLALAQTAAVDGRRFAAAAIAGYEVGGRIGRALVNPDFTRLFRPTGFTGPLAAAAAASRVLGLDAAQTASALSLAANMTGGLNQWPQTGADDMFFHPGIAARNGLTAARLASLGALGSEQALDGSSGLLVAYGPDRRVPEVRMFEGEPEILSVFFKPVPVCNFAQTPCLAALGLSRAHRLDPAQIAAVTVATSRAAKTYPGCDHAGPFARVLQAKMSIQHAVATALLRGGVDETSYLALDDPALSALAAKVTIEPAPEFTAAFPARQGAEVVVAMQDGRRFEQRLLDVAPADEAQIRARFRAAATQAIGGEAADALEAGLDDLDRSADVGALLRLASLPPARAA